MANKLRSYKSSKKLYIAIATIIVLLLSCFGVWFSSAWFKDQDGEELTVALGRIEIDDSFSELKQVSIPISLSRQKVLENDIIFTPTKQTGPLYTRFKVEYEISETTPQVARDIQKYFGVTPYSTTDESKSNFGYSWVRFGEYYYFCDQNGIPAVLTSEDYKAANEDCYVFLDTDGLLVSPRISHTQFSETEHELIVNISVEAVQARNICSEIDENGIIADGEDGEVDSISDIAHAFPTQYPTDEYTWTFKTQNGGTLNTISNLSYGEAVEYFVPEVAAASHFVEWNTLADGSGAAVGQEDFTSISESLTLYAITERDDVNILLKYNANGTITPSNGNNANYVVKYGQDQAFDIIPNSGYYISKILVNGAEHPFSINPGESYTVNFENVTTAQSLEVEFSVRQFTITYTIIQDSGDASDSTVESSSVEVPYGTSSYEINVTPPFGYYVDSIKIDNVLQTSIVPSGQPITFENITTNHHVEATFKRSQFTITYNKDSGNEEAGKENPTSYFVTDEDIVFNPCIKAGYVFEGWYSDSAKTVKATGITKGSTGNKTFWAKYIQIEADNLISQYGYQTFPNLPYTLTNATVTPLDEGNIASLQTKANPRITISMPANFSATNISQVRVFMNKNSSSISNFSVVTNSKTYTANASVLNSNDTWNTIEINSADTISYLIPGTTAGTYLINSIEYVTSTQRTNQGNVSLIAFTTALPANATYSFTWKKDSTVLATTSTPYYEVEESGTYYCTITITNEKGDNLIVPYTLSYSVVISRDLNLTMEDVSGVYTSEPYTAEVSTLPFGATVTYTYTGTLANGTNVTGNTNSVIDAGTYNVTAHVDGGELWNDTTVSCKITITKANLTLTASSVKVLPGDTFTNKLSSTATKISGLTYTSDKESVGVNSSGVVTISTANNVNRSMATISIDGGNNFNSVYYTVEQAPYMFSDSTTLSKYLGSESVVVIPSSVSGLNTISGGFVTTNTSSRSYTVNKIASNAISNITNIIELQLPSSVSSIAADGISALYSIQKIILGSTISSGVALSIVRDGTWFKEGNEVQQLLEAGVYSNTGVIEGVSTDWEWQLIDGVNTITKYLGSATNVKVPHRIYDIDTEEYVTVTAIKEIDSARKSHFKSFTISEKITKIHDNAFSQYTNVTRVTLPSTLTHIGVRAFYGLTNLNSAFNLEACTALTSIGAEAFRNCAYGIRGQVNLSKFTSLKTLGNYCFGDAPDLNVITLPIGITTMGNNIFVNDTELSTINFASGTSSFKSVNNVLYSSDDTKLYSYALKKNLTDFSIPASVNWISSYAFYNEDDLESITFLGNSYANAAALGVMTFADCDNLMTVVVPNGQIDSLATKLSGTSATDNKGFNDDAKMYLSGNANPDYGYVASTYTWTGICTIIVTQPANGTITPAGTIYATPGLNYTFTITPNPGFYITAITVDGANQTITANSSVSQTYTFQNISNKSHTITATTSQAVVEVYCNSAYTYYSDLAAALDFANGKAAQITILQDSAFSTAKTLKSGTNINLYSTKTLTQSATITVASGATLNIMSGTYNSSTISILNNGTLNINNGVINASNSASGAIENAGTLAINAGDIYGGTAHAILNLNGATTTITGGTINAKAGRTGILVSGGTLTLIGGTIHSTTSGNGVEVPSSAVSPVLNVTGIAFSGTSTYSIKFQCGTFNLSGAPTIASIYIEQATPITQPAALNPTNAISLYINGITNGRAAVTASSADFLDKADFNLTNANFSLSKEGSSLIVREIRTVTIQVKGSATNSTTYTSVGGGVRFGASGGYSSSALTYNLEYGQSVSIQASANSGYMFGGWFKDTTNFGSTTATSSNAAYTVTYDYPGTYNAYFIKTETVTVTLNLNKASGVSATVTLTPSSDKISITKTTLTTNGEQSVITYKYTSGTKALNASVAYSSGYYFNLNWTATFDSTLTASDATVAKTSDAITTSRSYTLSLTQLFTVTFSKTANVTTNPSAITHGVTSNSVAKTSTGTTLYAIYNKTATASVVLTPGSNSYNLTAGTSSAPAAATTKIHSVTDISLGTVTANKTIYYRVSQLFTLTFNITQSNATKAPFTLKYESTTAGTGLTTSQSYTLVRSTSAIATSLTPTHTSGKYNILGSNSGTPTATTAVSAANTAVSVSTAAALTSNQTVYYLITGLSSLNFYSDSTLETKLGELTATYGTSMPAVPFTAPIKPGYRFTGYNFDGTQYYTDSLVSARNWDKGVESANLIAQFVERQFTITGSANGGTITTTTGWTGTGSTATKAVTFNQTYGTLPTVTRSGYTFKNWTRKNEYVQIPYIQSTGTQYIDTGIKANQDTSIEIKAYTATTRSIYGGTPAFLNQTANASGEYFYWNGYNTGNSTVEVKTGKPTIYFQDKNNAYRDGVLKKTWAYTTWADSNNLFLFARNSSGTAGDIATGKIYYCKIWNAGVLVRDFIPCKRTSDNVIGLLDQVEGKFYTSPTGTLSGPTSYQVVEYIQSSGTQYINTGYYWQNENIRVYMDAIVTSNSSSQSLFGNEEYTTSSGSTRNFAGIPHGSNGTYNFYLGNGGQGSVAYGLNTRFTMDISTTTAKLLTVKKNDVVQISKTYGGSVLTKQTSYNSKGNGEIYIFANHNSNRALSTSPTQQVGGMKLFAFKMWDAGVLVRDFVPCVNGTTAGLYDIVEDKFYSSKVGNFAYPASSGEEVVTASTQMNIPYNHTIYANWTANTYTVTYNGNGATSGSTAQSTHTYDVSKALTANGFIRTGYTFAGWNTKADGSGTSYSDQQEVKNLATSGNVNLYAKWTSNTYYVDYQPNNGSGTMGRSTHYYGVSSNLTKNAFTRTGYLFQGWSTSSAATSVNYADQASVTTLSPIHAEVVNLYAVWKPISYTVVYNANGGTGTTASSSHTYDEEKALTANGFTRANHTFLGWSKEQTSSTATSATYTNQQRVSNLSSTNGATVTLYAVWAADTYQTYIINLGWLDSWALGDISHRSRFTFTENSSELSTYGGGGYEVLYTPVDLTSGKNYTFNWYYSMPTISADYAGIGAGKMRVQLLSSKPGAAAYNGSELVYFEMLSAASGYATMNYTPSSSATFYLLFNFGYCNDETTLNFKFSPVYVSTTGQTPFNTTPTAPSKNASRRFYDSSAYGDNMFNFDDFISSWRLRNSNTYSCSNGTASVDRSAQTISLTATGNDCYTQTYGTSKFAPILVKPSTIYTLSWTQSSTSVAARFMIFGYATGISTESYTNLTNMESGATQVSGTRYYLQIQTSASTRFLQIRAGLVNTGTSLTFSNIVLREGTGTGVAAAVSKASIPGSHQTFSMQQTSRIYYASFNQDGGTGGYTGKVRVAAGYNINETSLTLNVSVPTKNYHTFTGYKHSGASMFSYSGAIQSGTVPSSTTSDIVIWAYWVANKYVTTFKYQSANVVNAVKATFGFLIPLFAYELSVGQSASHEYTYDEDATVKYTSFACWVYTQEDNGYSYVYNLNSSTLTTSSRALDEKFDTSSNDISYNYATAGNTNGTQRTYTTTYNLYVAQLCTITNSGSSNISISGNNRSCTWTFNGVSSSTSTTVVRGASITLTITIKSGAGQNTTASWWWAGTYTSTYTSKHSGSVSATNGSYHPSNGNGHITTAYNSTVTATITIVVRDASCQINFNAYNGTR